MYTGPMYALSYPVLCDDTEEIIAWSALGFHASGHGCLEPGNEFTLINVVGEIPMWLQKRLQSAGVKITKTKERGPEIPTDTIALDTLATFYLSQKHQK